MEATTAATAPVAHRKRCGSSCGGRSDREGRGQRPRLLEGEQICNLCGRSGPSLPKVEGYHVHELCALWAPNVYQDDDGDLVNVHEEVERGVSMVRQACSQQPSLCTPIGKIDLRSQNAEWHARSAPSSRGRVRSG